MLSVAQVQMSVFLSGPSFLQQDRRQADPVTTGEGCSSLDFQPR